LWHSFGDLQIQTMGNFCKAVRGVMGWGLLPLALALAGAFSTCLNGLQLLNGLFCFSLVSATTSVIDSDISSFAISGYKNNHFYDIQTGPCAYNTSTGSMGADIESFCELNPWIQVGEGCGVSRSGKGFITCTQWVNPSRVYYTYILYIDCNQTMELNAHTFQLMVSPGSAFLQGVETQETGYKACVSVEVQRCQLNHIFYFQFAVVCASITLFIFLARALMRTTLVEPVSFRLSNSVRFYWLYQAFERYGFFSFFNPYKNEPYHLMKGEKFYKMVPPPLKRGSMDDPETGSSVEEPCVECFSWSTSDSVYKFSYDVVGNTLFAYSKDNLGFEKLKKWETDRRVVGEIRKYLQLKAQSACILTNDDVNLFKRHFLSLSEVYSLAKAGYRLGEEISDQDYRLYSKRRAFTPIKPGDESGEGSRHLDERENSDTPLRPLGSQTSA
jgi:hypothetical protein